MGDININFKNNYGESRHFTIWDVGRDPNMPPVIFEGYLDDDQETGDLTMQGEGSYGRAMWQRSDGSVTTQDVTDGNTYGME